MTCTRCTYGTCKRFGFFGKRRIQRWRCAFCNSTFCEPHTKLTRDTMLSNPDAAARAIQCLLEGCAIRSTERLTGLNRNTIMPLLETVGERCEGLMNAKMRGLNCRYVQCDEIWSFVGKKQRQARNARFAETTMLLRLAISGFSLRWMPTNWSRPTSSANARFRTLVSSSAICTIVLLNRFS